MSSGVLGVNASNGMDILGVIYQYTAVKDKADDFVVTVGNEDLDGNYLWEDTEDWSNKYGMRIRKVVTLPYLPIAKFGKGKIATTGTGTIEDANVIYMYRFDACFDPQSDPSCAGYVKPIPKVPKIIIYDALEDDNVKDATKETDRELLEETEEEINEDEEKDEDDMRLEMALASSTNALTIANELTQGSVVRAMNTATNITNYYVADISGGAYNDATPLEGGTIVDNKNAFKSLSQDNLMNEMIGEQYK
tara:strand:- start:402 stop:1151 length:750 start_codon:yes stop_codon:yes gene_type:complete